MNRKSFISTLTVTGLGAGILSNWVSCSPKVEKIKGLKNWAGNYTYKAAETKFVSTVEEMRRTILGLKKAKALGTQHCFNDIARERGHSLHMEADV